MGVADPESFFHRGFHADTIERLRREAEANFGSFGKRQRESRRDRLELGRGEYARTAGDRRRCERRRLRNAREGGDGAGEILSEDLAARNREAFGLRHQAAGNRETNEDAKGAHYCLRLLTCWYMSSAAFTTLEFAS